jgi:hypothetical protein
MTVLARTSSNLLNWSRLSLDPALNKVHPAHPIHSNIQLSIFVASERYNRVHIFVNQTVHRTFPLLCFFPPCCQPLYRVPPLAALWQHKAIIVVSSSTCLQYRKVKWIAAIKVSCLIYCAVVTCLVSVHTNSSLDMSPFS